MGLKRGSRDSELDGEGDESGQTAVQERREQPDAQTDTTDAAASEPGRTTGERPSKEDIPYVQRRDKVNEDREQMPFFLREFVIDGERDLQDSLEGMLGESVYKADYREAAMVVAERNPDLVAEVLREWGYDLQ